MSTFSEKHFNKPKLSCAISFNVHDSSVSFALDNEIVLVLEAERVFRIKKKRCDYVEMEYLVNYGLKILVKKIDDVVFWAMTTLNNPYLSYMDIIDIEKKSVRGDYYKKIYCYGKKRRVYIVNHHLAHAANILLSEHKSGIMISCDGGGDYNPSLKRSENLVVFKFDGSRIERLPFLPKNPITAKTYGVCSKYIYNDSPMEGKMMALAGLGKVREDYYDFLSSNYLLIESTDYFQVNSILDKAIPNLMGKANDLSGDVVDFAKTVQNFFVERRVIDIKEIMDNLYSGEESLMLVGGSALNLDLNSKIYKLYKNIKLFIPPCCDDTGQSIGALCLLIFNVQSRRPKVKLPYLGEGVENFIIKDNVLDKCVDILLNDGVVLIHNGKSEIGPRALGNRSFIARPDKLSVKKKISENIKKRESYRPVAPIVCADKFEIYFDGPSPSPFMLYSQSVKAEYLEKLAGAVHVDGTARVQTVDTKNNKFMYELISKFGEETGIYVLLNTSLNLKGLPVTNKIEESLGIYDKMPVPKCIIYNGDLLKVEY